MSLIVKNIGPVFELCLPIPEQGGLVVLRGANGVGKTKTLEAVQALVTGRGSLDARDGQIRGEVTGWGARLSVARSTRRTGELEVTSLEGRMDITELVDPGIRDPMAADARRIKALIGLSGVKADPTAYYALAGSKEAFEGLVKADTLTCTDPVDLAARVKRDFEAAARRAEDTAEKRSGEASAYRKATEGINLNGESDAHTLQAGIEQAVAADAEIRQRVKAATEVNRLATLAQERLRAQEAAYKGPTLLQAQTAEREAQAHWNAAVEATSLAQKALAAATRDEEAARIQSEGAGKALAAAEGYSALRELAEKAMESAAQTLAPDVSEVASATDAIARARRALENGAAIRMARQQIEAAEEAAELATEALGKAAQLRDAARGTDDILSQAVACTVLRVDGGRLVTDTDRGVEPYAELSMGEKWRIALDLAADQVGEGGIIVVPQEAYESLDPANRQAIHAHAVKRRVLILTAEATDGDLRAVPFQMAT